MSVDGRYLYDKLVQFKDNNGSENCCLRCWWKFNELKIVFMSTTEEVKWQNLWDNKFNDKVTKALSICLRDFRLFWLGIDLRLGVLREIHLVMTRVYSDHISWKSTGKHSIVIMGSGSLCNQLLLIWKETNHPFIDKKERFYQIRQDVNS